VPLRKAGTTFKGLCPFHGEKTPSFVVTPNRESWHCFGCGKGGDIFNFVMERDSIDFPTALRQLAGRAGVELSERTTREDAQRGRLRAALEAAIAFYHQVLTGHAAGQPALDYLRKRGFTDKTIETFQLGYAPDSWDALTRALTTKRDFREDDLEAAGLVARRQGGRSPGTSGPGGPTRRGVYDRFRGRIIFPIRDSNGGATGLGGRVVGTATDTAKYINTPATLLFDKSRTLYLIDKAKSAARKQQRIVLVEGNTDALMAHQEGFENVVCSMGTALTPGQVELATRYAPRIALAYDVDAAGQSAATFGATELTALVAEIERSPYRERLTDVDVVRLPAGRDPDEVIRDDPATWRAASENPQPIMDFLIDRYAARFDPKTISGREQLVNAVVPTLRGITDPVRRDGYVQALARRAGIDERVVREALQPRQAPSSIRNRDNQTGAKINLDSLMAVPGALDPLAVEKMLDRAEGSLLRLLLMRTDLVERARVRLTSDLLTTTPARELWKALESSVGEDGQLDRKSFLESLDPTLEAVARNLYARNDPVPHDEPALLQAVDQSVLTLVRNQLSETLDFKRAELSEAEASDDAQAVDRLTSDVRELQHRRLELDREHAGTSLLANRRISSHPNVPTPAGGPA
jgi:DNA primase